MRGVQGFLPLEDPPESVAPALVLQDEARKALFHDAVRHFDLLRSAGRLLEFEERELEESFQRLAQADTGGVAFPVAREGEPPSVALQREFERAFVAATTERWRERVAEFPDLQRLEEQARRAHERGGELTDLQARRALGVKNSYEKHLEARRERLKRAAERSRERSDSAYEASNKAVEHIPLGQPILVGHHSEGGHRRDLERAHRAMDRCVAEGKKAEHLERLATRVGRGGVSADDPDAVPKLREELAALELERELMKRVNKQFRRGGWQSVEGLSDDAKDRLEAAMARAPWVKAPFESYALSNMAANIRRVRSRIVELEARSAETPHAAVEGRGFRVEEAAAENRIRIHFDNKPEDNVRRCLKQNGFRWSPNSGAWQRQLNSAGREAATRVVEHLRSMDGENAI